jgi:hypothetical protein
VYTTLRNIGMYNIATETELEASSKDIWSMSCFQYVKQAVADVELELAEVQQNL